MARTPPPPATSYDLLSALPDGCITVDFSDFESLAKEAESIYENLEANHGDGNQYLVVTGLSNYALKKFKDDERHLLGVAYRLEYDVNTAIIKVPHDIHEDAPHRLPTMIVLQLANMGISPHDYQWLGATRYDGRGTNKAKEPDNCFHPPSRRRNATIKPWPTLIIEVGNSESMAQLHRDALWWFSNSDGDVRMVLIIKVKEASQTIVMEMWQLAPPGTPNPLSRAIINGFRANPPATPPLVQQPAASQQAYAIQEITITPTGATGQLVIPFHALYDRPPVGPESHRQTSLSLRIFSCELPLLDHSISQSYYSVIPTLAWFSGAIRNPTAPSAGARM